MKYENTGGQIHIREFFFALHARISRVNFLVSFVTRLASLAYSYSTLEYTQTYGMSLRCLRRQLETVVLLDYAEISYKIGWNENILLYHLL